MGRPARFSRAQVQTAALELVDRKGLDALSMRALARRLRTGPMTLYNHVVDRDDLERLLVDAVMRQVRAERPRGRGWKADVERQAVGMWRALRAHRQLIPLIVTKPNRSPEARAVGERLRAALEKGGFVGARLAQAHRLVSALIVGLVLAQMHGPVEGGDSERDLRAGLRAVLR